MALGANALNIMALVVGRSAMMAAFGVIIGGAVAYAAGRSIAGAAVRRRSGRPHAFGAAIAVALLMTLAAACSRLARGARRSNRRHAIE